MKTNVLKTAIMLCFMAFAGYSCKPEDTEKNYTVTFSGEDISIENQSVAHGNYIEEPQIPERENYTFGGWFIDNQTFTKAWDFKTNVVTRDTTLFAKWTVKEDTLPKRHTVIFSGESILIEPQPVAHGNYIEEPQIPERENYNFGGWFIDNQTFTTAWNFQTDVVTRDTTLFAKWIEKKDTSQDEHSALAKLLLGKWELVKYEDLQTASSTIKPDSITKSVVIDFIDFDSVNARSLANTLMGEYVLTSDSIKFINLICTAVGEPEWGGNFIDALYNVDKIKIENDVLFLFYDNSKKVMLFNKLN